MVSNKDGKSFDIDQAEDTGDDLSPMEARVVKQMLDKLDFSNPESLPIAPLYLIDGKIQSVAIPLKGFHRELETALNSLDTRFRVLTKRIDFYSEAEKNNARGQGHLRHLEEIRGEISSLLAKRFSKVFEFLIDTGDDSFLKSTIGLSRKAACDMFYAWLNSYEIKYGLNGNTCVVVKEFAVERAKKSGEKIVEDVSGHQLDGKEIFGKIAKSMIQTTPGSGRYISKTPTVIPPPGIAPMSHSGLYNVPPLPEISSIDSSKDISIESRAVSTRIGHAVIVPAPFPIDKKSPITEAPPFSIPKRDTMRWGGIGTAPPEGSWEAKNPEKVKELERAAAEAKAQAEKEWKDAQGALRAAAKPLSRITTERIFDVSVTEKNAASDEAPTTLRNPREFRKEEEGKVDVKIVSLPPAPEISFEESDDALTEITGIYQVGRGFSSSNVENMVAGEPVAYETGIITPPKSREFVHPQSLVELSAEATADQEQNTLRSIPEDQDEETLTEIILPPASKVDEKNYFEAEKPKSWFSKKWNAVKDFGKERLEIAKQNLANMKRSAANAWNSAKNAIGNFWGKSVKPLRKYAGRAVLALTISGVAATAISNNPLSNRSTESPSSSPSNDQAPKNAPPENSSIPIAPVNPIAPQSPIAPVAPIETNTAPTFANVLLKSKSPFVQQIIKDGKLTLGNNTITDSMIGAFRGLATDEQKVQIMALEQQINLGLGVYFNEHFGTEAKIAESLKDPRMRNLYKTAKVAFEKGWVARDLHTKARYPAAYLLGARLLGDSAELGQDESDNTDPEVKARVSGNVFQAKHPGSTINLKKANGHYHVVTEYMMRIFNGEEVKTMVADDYLAEVTPGAAPQKGTLNKVEQKTGNQVDQNIIAPKAADQGKQGTFLPNIAPQQMGVNNDLDELDKGWNDLFEKAEKNGSEKVQFDKSGIVEFEFPLTMTTYEENQAILPTVIEKVVELHPEADAAKIRKLIKQFGFVGFKYERLGRGKFKVEMNKNFMKILKPQLKKSPIKVS